jgi:hypothetical protein
LKTFACLTLPHTVGEHPASGGRVSREANSEQKETDMPPIQVKLIELTVIGCT